MASPRLKYPDRKKTHYALRVIKQLTARGAIQTMGQPAAILVVVVATTEDSKHYESPPDFYNEQLLTLLGMRKWESLDRARRTAIEHGWLVYLPPPNGTRAPGVYWSKLPEEDANHPPDHIRETDEVVEVSYPQNGYGRGDGHGYGQGDGRGELPYPYLNPNLEAASAASCAEPSKENSHSSSAGSKPANGKAARSKSPTTYTDDFERWWGHYPKKVGKREAAKAFYATIRHLVADSRRGDLTSESEVVQFLIDRVQAYASVAESPYIKHPQRWLNEARYDDEHHAVPSERRSWSKVPSGQFQGACSERFEDVR